MVSLAWFLTVAVVIVWLSVGIGILRDPPALPRAWGRGPRRGLWLLAWVAALVAGWWGPEVWSSSAIDRPREAASETGMPAEVTTSELRTPVLVRALRVEQADGDRVLSVERRVAMQVPPALVGFLLLVAWIRVRERRRLRTGLALLVLLSAPAACGGDPPGGESGRSTVPFEVDDRPERRMVELEWDTLVHLQMTPEDTLFYEANDVVASERGIWVLDRSGSRVVHLDWEGELRWYAGSRGAGPGELTDPRYLDLDALGRVWVLDMGVGRASAWDPDGRHDASISLQPLGADLRAFSVDARGERVLGMVLGEAMQPVAIDAQGNVESGEPIVVGDVGEGLFGIALQGYIAGEPGSDRWAYAFMMGDGLYLFDGTALRVPRRPFPEPAGFPSMTATESRGADGSTVRTQELSSPEFTAASVAIAEGRLLVRFIGRTEARGYLLDVYDLETGEYVETLPLPRPGAVAAVGDRLVLAWNDPAPGLLVLRSSR